MVRLAATTSSVKGIMVDSGAQITAFPHRMLMNKNYELVKTKISKLQGVDGTEVPHYGHTDVRLKRGGDVLQISAESADVEYPVMSTDAITKQGKSVLHSNLEEATLQQN